MYPLVFRHKLSEAVKISDTFVLRRLQTQSSDKLRKQESTSHHPVTFRTDFRRGGDDGCTLWEGSASPRVTQAFTPREHFQGNIVMAEWDWGCLLVVETLTGKIEPIRRHMDENIQLTWAVWAINVEHKQAWQKTAGTELYRECKVACRDEPGRLETGGQDKDVDITNIRHLI